MSRALLMTAACLAPAALALWAHRAATRPHAPPSLFGFAQRAQWAGLLAFVLWLPAFLGHGESQLLNLLDDLGARILATPWTGAALAGPPLLILALVGLLGHDVARRSGITAWSWRAAWTDSLLLVGGGVAAVTLFFAGLGAFGIGAPRLAVVSLLCAIGVAAAIGGARRRSAGLTPEAIMRGDLRDHVFELAARAGVKLKQLYVIPLRRFRLANAFAVQGEVVWLTDELLARLDRAEVEAVLLHEMAHLARRDPARVARGLLLAGLAAGLATAFGGWWGLALALPPALVAYLAYARRIEHQADVRAIELGARPESLIAGLARLGQLLQVPVRGSTAAQWLMTHPSLERRARALAAHADMDPSHLLALTHDPPPVRSRWAIPDGVSSPRAFGSEFRRRITGRAAWLAIAASVIGPVGVVAAATWLSASGVAEASRALVFTGAVAAGVLGWLVTLAIMSHRPMLALRRMLEPRLHAVAAAGRPAGASFFVGFATGTRPLFYEGFTEHDVGSLVLVPGCCVFVGEELRFELAPGDVRAIEWDYRMPGWIRVPAVLMRWERADGESGSFRLFPIDRDPLASRAGARRLLADLEAWHRDRAAAPAAVSRSFGPPPQTEVTGVSPQSLVQPQAVVITWIIQAVLAIGIGVAAGLPGSPFEAGAFDVAVAAVAGQIVAMLPYLRHRDPGDVRPQAAERRAA
jgi:Zn-dependent protease with chaperone function